MSSPEHVPLEQLADFLEGRLPAEAEAAVEAHLASGCPLCSNQAAWLRRLIRALPATGWPIPPPWAHRRAVKAFRALVSRQPRRAWRLAWGSLAVVLIVGAILLGVTQARTLQTSSPAAAVSQIAGMVEVRQAPDTEWRSPAEGDLLPAGAEIHTAAGGHASLVFPGGDRLRLTDNTRLTVAALTRSAGRWEISLLQVSGQASHWVGQDTAWYQVQTPAGEVVAHGTRFDVKVESDGTTIVSVSEGAVTATTKLDSVVVAQGDTAHFAPGGAPTLVPAGAAPPRSAPTQTPFPTSSRTAPVPTTSSTPESKETELPEGSGAPEVDGN